MQKPLGTMVRELAVLLGILVLIFIGIWLVREQPEEAPKTRGQSVIPSPQERVSSTSFADSDADGLFDWEEALWGTDAGNSDTDADGTSDGAEISLNRDPTKAGPGDIAQPPLTIPIRREATPTVPNKPLIRGPLTEKSPAPVVTIDATQRENPLHAFGNAIGAPIMTSASEHDAELLFWNSLVGNIKMDARLLEGLVKLASKYETLAESVAKVAPPEEARTAHTALVNGYHTYAKAIQKLAQTETGSYLSAEALTTYSESTLTLARAVVAMSDLFYQKRITFTPAEPGSIFVFPR